MSKVPADEPSVDLLERPEGLPEVRGFLPNSLNEWRGRLAAVIFLPACNLRCPFCHGWRFVLQPESMPEVTYADIEEKLLEHEGWLDGVVVSGGEPTLHPGLGRLLAWFREQGLQTKLETNGLQPVVVAELLAAGLLDAVALDMKALPDAEHLGRAVGGVPVAVEDWRHTVATVAAAGVELEVHTTLCPMAVQLGDLVPMAEYLGENAPEARWVLQRYNPEDVLDLEQAGRATYTLQEVEDELPAVRAAHAAVEVRGF